MPSLNPTHGHPLDPFTPFELTRAVEILRTTGQVSEAARFSAALPVEPSSLRFQLQPVCAAGSFSPLG